MITNNRDSFWNTTLDNQILKRLSKPYKFVEAIKELYTYWDKTYCPQGIINNIGLKGEPYFRYFDYEDFLTPNSGLIQIRKFAVINNNLDLLKRFNTISEKTKSVKEEFFRVQVEECKYFSLRHKNT